MEKELCNRSLEDWIKENAVDCGSREMHISTGTVRNFFETERQRILSEVSYMLSIPPDNTEAVEWADNLRNKIIKEL